MGECTDFGARGVVVVEFVEQRRVVGFVIQRRLSGQVDKGVATTQARPDGPHDVVVLQSLCQAAWHRRVEQQ